MKVGKEMTEKKHAQYLAAIKSPINFVISVCIEK